MTDEVDKSDIRIPYPLPGHERVLYDSTKMSRARMHVALMRREKAQVHEAAELTGCSVSEFTRWALVFAAREVLRRQGKLDE